MTRTMIKTEAALLLAVALTGLACSREYKHRRLETDSRETACIQRLLQGLRSAGEAGVDSALETDAASGLSDAQRRFLKGTLLELVRAESVELVRSDRFGEEFCRATFRLTSAKGSRDVSILFVDTGGGDLRWFQRN
jgi:hypothetical protein